MFLQKAYKSLFGDENDENDEKEAKILTVRVYFIMRIFDCSVMYCLCRKRNTKRWEKKC